MAYTQQDLLEAGVHFGHLTRKWNPRMAPYIFMEQNGIHIIDLKKTESKLEEAKAAAKNIARSGRRVLFVATKKQAKEIVAEEKTVAYLFNQPQKITINKPFLVSEEDTERSYEITFSQWMLLSADKDIAVPTSYVVTLVEPLDSVKQMYLEKVNGPNNQVSSTQE